MVPVTRHDLCARVWGKDWIPSASIPNAETLNSDDFLAKIRSGGTKLLPFCLPDPFLSSPMSGCSLLRAMVNRLGLKSPNSCKRLANCPRRR